MTNLSLIYNYSNACLVFISYFLNVTLWLLFFLNYFLTISCSALNITLSESIFKNFL